MHTLKKMKIGRHKQNNLTTELKAVVGKQSDYSTNLLICKYKGWQPCVCHITDGENNE